MAIEQRLEFVVLDMIESASRNFKALPLNLGGLSGSLGGVGSPPGGFIGQLIQIRVAYDETEAATLTTPISGMSLLDNLNHIRYRIGAVESGGALSVQDYDGNPFINPVDTITFSGFVLTNQGGGNVLVEHIAGSGEGAAITVQEYDGSPIVSNVDKIIFSGAVVTDLGGGDVLVTISGGVEGPGGNETHIDQSGGTSDTYGVLVGSVNGSNALFTVSQVEYISGSLSVYLNGQLQTQGSSEDWVETNPASGTFTFNTAPLTGDLITCSYLVAGVATENADTLDGYHASAFVLAPIPVSPGGRLTLTTAVPVTTSDVTGATTVYYTPSIHNLIQVWDGTKWETVTFSETSLSIGTVTSGLPYDIFCYLSSGILTLEKLAWTNGTTRATGVSLQDGRYCKTGDKTRLYLGSFYTTSTTQTEDSEAKRFLWNMYNRRRRTLKVENGSNHNYNVATVRAFNNSQANSDFEYFVGIVEDSVEIMLTGQGSRISTDGAPRISIAVNSTSTELGLYGWALGTTTTGRVRGGSSAAITPTLGYSFICIVEFSSVGTAPGATFESATMNGIIWS